MMFDELENAPKSKQNNNNGTKKSFPIDGITNKEIGSKIKSFAKVFLKIQNVILIILAFISVIGCLATLEDSDGLSLLILIGAGITYFLIFIFNYYVFLFISGFGAVVEDVNAIKSKK